MNRNLLIAAASSAIVAGAVGVLIGRGAGPQSTTKEVTSAETQSTSIELTTKQIATSGIQLVTVDAGSFSSQVTASGEVVAQMGAEGVLAARTDGALVRLFKRLGDPVNAGEVVAYIESQQAADLAAQRSSAAAELNLARARYRRERLLYSEHVTARQDLETAAAELAKAQADAQRAIRVASAARVAGDGRTAAVTSPTYGRISAAPAVLGAFVSAGTELYRVIDPRRIEFRVSLPVAQASRIAQGAGAIVQSPGVGAIAAHVRSITPEADPVSRAAVAVLSPNGPTPALRPGQAVRASIAAVPTSSRSSLTVPVEAVQLVDGRDAVFVRTPTGFRPQTVTVGERTTDRAEILAGLRAGQVIAGHNAFLIKAQLAAGQDEEGGHE